MKSLVNHLLTILIFLLLLISSSVKCFENLFKKNKQTTYFNNSMLFYSTVLPDSNKPLNYCSFFNNRAPSPQVNLKNCTWYKENSCCLQSEIESTFSKVKPLIGSSELCQQYLNKLMCYICAPNQYKFYGKERLTVCVQFCDQMYDACSHAILKGYRINEIYSNGSEFCQSRRYNVHFHSQENCFYYIADHKSYLLSSRSGFISNKFLIIFLFHFLLIFT
jgi:hypothetical protein